MNTSRERLSLPAIDRTRFTSVRVRPSGPLTFSKVLRLPSWDMSILMSEFCRMVSRMTSEVRMSSSSWVMTMAEVDILRAVFHSSRRYGAMVSLEMAFHASSMAMTL